MNIQDIADFLDLVKNPDKFQKYVDTLKEEQVRLNAAIETVGKASELDTLRKQVEKQQAKLEKVYQTKQDAQDTEYKSKLDAVAELQTKAETEFARARTTLAEANQLKATSDEIIKGFSQRDKELRKQEQFVENLKNELATSVAEYNEKLAKLRSVMN